MTPGITMAWPNSPCAYRIVAITVDDDGAVRFIEQCDDYYQDTLSPDDAVAALEEAIRWIRQKVDTTQAT